MLESCPHDRPGDMANLNYTLEDSSVRNALNAGVTIIKIQDFSLLFPINLSLLLALKGDSEE